ncbi:MAG: AAA family ATPase [Rhodospirillales bacterium]
MSLTRLQFSNFSVFKELDLRLSPGINVLIGGNGCGKTHLMKAAYAACDVAGKNGGRQKFPEKLAGVFLPLDNSLGRLVNRRAGRAKAEVTVSHGKTDVSVRFSTVKGDPGDAVVGGGERWSKLKLECAYIPVKEMLANAPGFLSLYENWNLSFEEVYADILQRAFLPMPRGPRGAKVNNLLNRLHGSMEGSIHVKGETFFHKGPDGDLEFTLVAEGLRKLGLLWLLIRNGTLLKGSVLFWDEPETNLNPVLIGAVCDILLELQRAGVQVILATHSYSVLKEFDLRREKKDKISFISLSRNGKSRAVNAEAADDYADLEVNRVSEAMNGLYDRTIEKSIAALPGANKKRRRA